MLTREFNMNNKGFKVSGFIDEIDTNFEKQLQAAHGLGLKYACLRDIDGKRIQKFTHDEIRSYIIPLLNQYKIGVSSIGSGVGKIILPDENACKQDLEELKKICEAARLLNCRYIRVFSFYSYYSKSGIGWEAERAHVVEQLKKYIEIAEQHDVVLLHENEKMIYGDSPERCLDLYNELGGPHFKLIFDFANYIQSGYDPKKCYGLLKGKIEYFHIKDAVLKTGMVVPAGQGDGHVRDIISEEIKNSYHGFFTIEPHLSNFSGLKSFEAMEVPVLFKGSAESYQLFALAYHSFINILKEEGC